MVRQLVPVVAPLLVKRRPEALMCIRAAIDFFLIANYYAHDEASIGYLEHALARFDKLKWAFEDVRESREFNMPKIHAMTHYSSMIRRFGLLKGVSTEMGEGAHRSEIKRFDKRTNKDVGYETQLLRHNSRKLRMNTLKGLLYEGETTARPEGHEEPAAQVTSAFGDVDFAKQGWGLTDEDRHELKRLGLRLNYWRRAREVEERAEIQDLVEALAVFVRRERSRCSEEVDVSLKGSYSRESDAQWAGEYFIRCHTGLRYWRHDGRDGDDVERLVDERLRCTTSWRQGVERRDCVWLEPHQGPGGQSA